MIISVAQIRESFLPMTQALGSRKKKGNFIRRKTYHLKYGQRFKVVCKAKSHTTNACITEIGKVMLI